MRLMTTTARGPGQDGRSEGRPSGRVARSRSKAGTGSCAAAQTSPGTGGSVIKAGGIGKVFLPKLPITRKLKMQSVFQPSALPSPVSPS